MRALSPLRSELRLPLAVALGVFAFCALGLYLTTTFASVPPILRRGMQPATFPQILLILLALFALLMLLEARRSRWPQLSTLPREFFLTLASGVLFVLLSAFVDFFIALAAFALSSAYVWGERRWLALLGVAVLFPALVGLLFNGLLDMRFPRGVLTNLIYQ